MSENTHEAMLLELVDEMLRELKEHFDSVQILATYDDEDGMSHFVSMGKGNWYSRMGICREFLARDQASVVANKIGEVIVEGTPPDDGETWKS